MSEKVTIGPFHPELEESVYFKLQANDNKVVTSIDLVNGFIHRGMEALVTQKNFMQNLILTERVCSLCSNNHPFAYALAVEKIAGVKVPQRAEALRVVADEVKRSASNLFNLAMMSHLIHHHDLMKETMEARELMQDLKEIIWGNRMDMSANTLTGVKYDLDDEKVELILKTLETFEPKLESLTEQYENDETVVNRTVGIGVLPKVDAQRLGVTGPVARGSGINNDVRVKAPYALYGELKPKVTLRDAGDVHARAMCRLGDIAEAVRMIKDVVNDLPEGPVVLEKRPHIPAGEATVRVEAPRGELIYYLKTDGTQKPVRMRWKVPTYTNWEALKVMILGDKVSDVTLILNSIDPCISCTER
ncbi:nickel-dependent hydrogenase large subunit [Hydrogenimonas thermophila]|uniref:hydrogenase large subunit n=1 Tax=Hydrogenimonas thermophila TaxID=223786 RepID=UPI0029372ECA|nr:nickel-dependent hydrogenase large subunit [Hydrogenimonas thermophila]WOE69825.1 nickel-dependent hydrogenase large subunit [Hydrogenimonas thermophila]WOE72340.1 nickel-dependent hydrogenase large subunit [Hydrogenimonas thermophila]